LIDTLVYVISSIIIGVGAYYSFKSLSVRRRVIESLDSPERRLKEALTAREQAEEVARKREEDLMIMTHQLLGPLSAVVGTITSIQQKNLPVDIKSSLENIHAWLEDAITLCYGTFASFAYAAGKRTAFGTDNINAPVELKKLALRLQKTNQRSDLRFIYKEDINFPRLQMDRNVFTSVMYSIIHNVMKYADSNSEVVLECSFERDTEKAALKIQSRGEPIQPKEAHLIFEKFRRGQSIEKTGRHHSGVGLGLWVARELMRAVSGDLAVELNPNEPRLSVFVVHIPKTSE
jgi:K+-sensing histidine kinase KdpD